MGPLGMGGMEMLIVMLFYSGVGLPLGVPPAEQDPLMLRVAPEECLYYTTWAGMAEPQADANPTEALLAEPEVKEFVKNLDVALVAAFAEVGERATPQGKLLAESAPLWIKTALTRPTAIYISELQVHQDRPPVIEAGAIVNTGDNTAAVRDSLLKLQAVMPEEFGLKEVEIGGVTFYQFRPEEGAPLITWGTRGNYLLVGLGDGAIEKMFANARTEPPAWLTDLQKSLPVERTSTLTYADLPAMINSGLKGMNADDAKRAQKMLNALGLSSIKAYGSVTGLDQEGFVNRTSLAIDGKGRGLFTLADAKPLTAKDLAMVPADSTIAFALRLDSQKVLDIVREVSREVDPKIAAQVDEGLDTIHQMLGLDLREEILSALGDTWCVYNSANEGGLLFTGVTATVDLRDKAKADKAYKQLMALAEAALQRPADDEFGYYRPPQLKKIEFQGQTIHYLTGIEDVPLAPAWCMTDTHLIVALYPQSIEALLARDEDFQSLATTPDIARTLAAEAGPLSVSYVDTKTLFEMLYPLGQIAATAGLNALAEETGVDIDVTILPQADSIARHLRPNVTTITRSAGGIEFNTRQSLPGGSVGSTAPVAVALLLPAIQSAREAARRMQSMNNLKQIALAMHNHADTFRNFPPASIKTKEGKPGLSWRVKILPFIEEQDLYDQFDMDQPWDSEHNKALIAKIPAVYRSPASAAQPGYTTYLGVAGKDGVFSNDDKGTRFADIRDGTSNTMMVVEVNDRGAVPWTKPDDFDPDDGMKPTEKLDGVWNNVFLGAMGDGSVHAVSTSVAPDVLKALFTKSGGEAVGAEALDGGFRGDRAPRDAFDDAPLEAVPEEAFDPEPELDFVP